MITNIFLSFLGISIVISFVIVLLLLFTPVLNKRYAIKWKYWIWIVLALRLIIPLGGNIRQPVTDTQRQRETVTSSEYEKTSANTLDNRIVRRRIVVEIPAQMTTSIVLQPEKISSNISLLDIFAFAWMSGGLLLVSVHLFSYFHYKRQILKKGKAVKDGNVLFLLLKLKRELHIKREVRVMKYTEAASPMVIGFFHPVLVLPEEQYNSEEQFFILKHELIHLKRGDLYFKLLFVAANAVHWFNPLVWIMQKEAVVDMELSCYEKVTQGADRAMRKAYIETLLSTLHKQSAKRTVLSTGFYGGKQIMKKRFKNILVNTVKRNGVVILVCVAILTAMLGTLVGCSISTDVKTQTEALSSIEGEIQAMETVDPEEYFNLTWNPLLLNFYNTFEGQKTLYADYADLVGEGMSIGIDVLGDDILEVTIRYEDSALLTDGIEEMLAQQLDSMTERFQEQRSLYCTDIIGPASVRILTVQYIY